MPESKTADVGVLHARRLEPGSVIAGNLVVREVRAEGGMGTVYVAEQKSTGKLRAVKVMHRDIVADTAAEKRFEIEARVGSQIASEHVVDVISAGIDERTKLPYLVMELLDGEDLRQRTKRDGALSHAEVRTIFEQLCHAMTAAHEAGVVHRDLKPENVFLAKTLRAGSSGFTVKVLDFGIAKLAQETGATRATRGALGSPLWMAPEQTAPGPITPAADVWALGLLAYELLTGKSYWKTANLEGGTAPMLLREIVLDVLPLASERAESQGTASKLPKGFDAWFERCLHRDPAGRYRDARDAWRALDDVFAGRLPESTQETLAKTAGSLPPNVSPKAKSVKAPTAADPPPLAQEVAVVRAPPSTSNRVVVLVAAGAIVVVLATAGGILAGRTSDPRPQPEPGPERSPGPASASTPASASASASASAAPHTVTSTAFSDPVDRGTPLVVTLGDHKLRMLVRVSSNESPVADSLLRSSIESSSWRFTRCYSSAFASFKNPPEGTVSVSYQIEDSLPRQAKIVSSTFDNKTMNECMVATVTGQMLNGVPSAARGRAVHTFRFLP